MQAAFILLVLEEATWTCWLVNCPAIFGCCLSQPIYPTTYGTTSEDMRAISERNHK